jgi:plastocyanin
MFARGAGVARRCGMIILAFIATLMLLPTDVLAQTQGSSETPSTVTVAIVGTTGAGSFTPNPVQVRAGSAVVWKNNDGRTHHIVLDNGGADLGNIQPGDTSRSVTIANTTPVTFHCTIHPSMVGSINGSAPPAASAQTSSAYGYDQAPGTGAQPEYPGIPPSQNKVETEIGSYRVRFYGTVLLNTSVSRAGIFGQDIPLWTLPSGGNVTYPDGTVGHSSDSHDLIFTMRQSIVGLTLNQSQPSDKGWTSSALIEADFFGSRAVDTVQPQDRVLNHPRLRTAYFQLEHKGVKLLFGQAKMILAPLDPVSLSHVALPLGATAGDLWAWMPQVRLELKARAVLFQAGVLRPQFGDSRLETPPAASTAVDTTSSGLGERSTQPFYQARAAVLPRIAGRTATLGIAAHTGKERIGVSRDLKSWAVALDADVPITGHFVARGEWFAGSNLIPFEGGIDQGAAVLASPIAGAAPLQIRGIGTHGGWWEATVLPGSRGRDAVYVGAGQDEPKRSQLLPGSTRGKNEFIWASYFHKLNDAVTAAVEWSNWRFQTVAFTNNVAGPLGPTSRANVVNVSFGYQF